MKRLLIAAAALSLMAGGYALAQPETTPSPSAAMPSPSSDPTSQSSAMPAAPASSSMPAANADTSSPSAAAAAPTSATEGAATPSSDVTASPASSSATTATASAGSPPAAYPLCHGKTQDRCVNPSQATRMAVTTTRRHLKRTITTETGGQAPASVPGSGL